jgi:hypothetical protein
MRLVSRSTRMKPRNSAQDSQLSRRFIAFPSPLHPLQEKKTPQNDPCPQHEGMYFNHAAFRRDLEQVKRALDALTRESSPPAFKLVGLGRYLVL